MANSGKVVTCEEKLARCKRLVSKWRIMASKVQTGDIARFVLRACANDLEQALEPDKGRKSKDKR